MDLRYWYYESTFKEFHVRFTSVLLRDFSQFFFYRINPQVTYIRETTIENDQFLIEEQGYLLQFSSYEGLKGIIYVNRLILRVT